MRRLALSLRNVRSPPLQRFPQPRHQPSFRPSCSVEQGPNSVFITTMLYDRVTDAGCAGSTEGGCVGSLQNFRFVAVPPDLTLFVQHSWTTYWGHQGETPLVCLQSPQAGVEAVTVIEGASCDHPLSTPGEPATKLSIGDVLLDAGISSIDDRNMGWMGALARCALPDRALNPPRWPLRSR